jgi:hypothetical protein
MSSGSVLLHNSQRDWTWLPLLVLPQILPYSYINQIVLMKLDNIADIRSKIILQVIPTTAIIISTLEFITLCIHIPGLAVISTYKYCN